jgi:hypothetical protein
MKLSKPEPMPSAAITTDKAVCAYLSLKTTQKDTVYIPYSNYYKEKVPRLSHMNDITISYASLSMQTAIQICAAAHGPDARLNIVIVALLNTTPAAKYITCAAGSIPCNKPAQAPINMRLRDLPTLAAPAPVQPSSAREIHVFHRTKTLAAVAMTAGAAAVSISALCDDVIAFIAALTEGDFARAVSAAPLTMVATVYFLLDSVAERDAWRRVVEKLMGAMYSECMRADSTFLARARRDADATLSAENLSEESMRAEISAFIDMYVVGTRFIDDLPPFITCAGALLREDIKTAHPALLAKLMLIK